MASAAAAPIDAPASQVETGPVAGSPDTPEATAGAETAEPTEAAGTADIGHQDTGA